MGLHFAGDRVVIDLWDGRRVSTPLAFYPTLAAATARQRVRWDFVGLGTGIEWPDFDLQLSAAGIAAGRRETIPPPGWREGLAARLAQHRARRTAARDVRAPAKSRPRAA